MTEDPQTIRELLISWRGRAAHREDSMRRMGVTTIEGRILSAAVSELRLCIAELEQIPAPDQRGTENEA